MSLEPLRFRDAAEAVVYFPTERDLFLKSEELELLGRGGLLVDIDRFQSLLPPLKLIFLADCEPGKFFLSYVVCIVCLLSDFLRSLV